MSERTEAVASHLDTEQLIIDYLRDCPDFFERHLDVLETLRVPHPCQPAVSLIERQVQLLRDNNLRLRRKLQELIEVARNNDSLTRRMQVLALGLIEAATLDELLTNSQCVLRDEFNADFIALRLAARPQVQSQPVEREFVTEAELALFDSSLRTERPRCGRLTAEQTVNLFDDAAPRIASAALVPLRGSGWRGLLAIGSCDADRFRAGMGTLFLSRIGDLLSHALQAHLRPLEPADRF